MSYNSQTVVFAEKSHTTATLGSNDPQIGTQKTFDDVDCQWVYNEGNSEIDPGKGVVLIAGSGTSGYSVTISSTTSVDLAFGVCKYATIATSYYGWVAKRGLMEVEMEADNSCVTGQLLALADNGEFALKSNSTGYPTPAIGKAMESMASGASGLAYISIF